MLWGTTAIVAAFIASLVLCFIYLYLSGTEKKFFLKLWFVGWLIYSLRFVFALLNMTTDYKKETLAMTLVAGALSALFLMHGNNAFLGRKINKQWYLLAVLVAIYSLIAPYSGIRFEYMVSPSFIFAGTAFIYTGYVMYHAEGLGSFGRKIVGIAMVIWGIHKYDYPFLRHVDWFAPIGFIIGSTLAIVVAIGLILAYYESVKGELQQRLEENKILLDEKGLLIKEVHHRVKNNLQIIISLMYLEASGSDLEETDMFKSLSARISSIAVVHELLYKRDQLTEIETDVYVEKIVLKMLQSLGLESSEITVKINADKVELPFDYMSPLGLIISECVTNFYKHVYKKGLGDEISFSVTGSPENLCLAVEDNGPGLPDNVNFDEASSTGIILLKSLSEQIGGRLEFSSGADGLKYFIYFNTNYLKSVGL